MTEATNRGTIIVSAKQAERRIIYQKLFWLFIAGSLLGVPIEGISCLVNYGRWETHVVSIWGPFCIIYGIGAVGMYVGAVAMANRKLLTKFIAFTLIGTGVEFFCGWVLEYGLHMAAWDYSQHFMNIRGYVSLKMALMWGVLGVGFCFAVPALERLFDKMKGRGWRAACVCLTVFMAVNLFATGLCIVRWKNRHEGVPAGNHIERIIDEAYPDARMEERFMEWRFIDG